MISSSAVCRASAIAVDENTNTIYVTSNGAPNTVSVIDGNDNKVKEVIPVGRSPSAIAVDHATDTIYVTNFLDDTVSVIDPVANKVVARVMFNIEPFNSGHIQCENTNASAPITKEFYIDSGSECIAKPYPGFDFVSWQENLGRNATQLISLLSPPSIWDSILDFLQMKPEPSESKLNKSSVI
jgi:YVTN family beta-propeller protein